MIYTYILLFINVQLITVDVMDNTSFQSLNSKIISIPKDLSSCKWLLTNFNYEINIENLTPIFVLLTGMEPSNVVLSDISIPNLGTDAIIMSNSTCKLLFKLNNLHYNHCFANTYGFIYSSCS